MEHHSSYSSLDDKDLMVMIAVGNRDAFTCLYHRYFYYLYTLAMRYLKDESESEDILQQVFIKLWQMRDSGVIKDNVRGYLFAMTRNSILNYVRNKNRLLQRNYRLSQEVNEEEQDIWVMADKEDLILEMKKAIDGLPPQQKQVANLRCEGLSNQEIASRLHLSLNTVNSHYTKGLKALKTTLGALMSFILIYIGI
jgi:RNA polymerase sigma-70 factor (ECF subfamily)